MRLNKTELTNISGGAISVTTGILIVSIVAFLIGVVDGFLRPKGCNDAT